ncbi:hypothetical protein PHLCEN_2v6643 [Hermanssonia centrifuga]|uniref:chitin deacetylase n=1 Tax=Hermanssonia centrifuga TaxID=98765 RepID=A0A2R6NZG8_9APHY|nr:hypothetical protein PHLCEN_2v6643 [Hermanssonia centrifuga]
MKFALLSAIALPALVSANHNAARHDNVARQAPPPTSSAPLPGSSVGSAPPPAATGSAVGSAPVTGSVPPAVSSVSFSLASINPTAVSLSDIVAGTLTTQATLPLTTTYAAGANPSYLPNAPPLPNLATVIPTNYPKLDVLPPTDSPEVLQWIAEVNASGITIPDIPVTVLGGCPANPAAAADTTRCWWSCGGCVRDSDITTCPDKLTWGLTYDDGPAPYTPDLLQYLNANDLTTTFFVVGSRAISYPALLQEEYMAQHQIAVHTWSHPYMTTVSTEGLIAELGWSKKIIKDVTGVTPIYFRPPYGDIDDRVRAIAKAMDLIPVMWTRISPLATFDTGDYNVAGGTITVTQVLQNWEEIIGNATQIDTGFIVLEHDLFAQTVDIATGYILPAALANKPSFNIKPVISCLNKPLSDAYLETNDNSSNPLPSGTNAAPGTFTSGAPGSSEATGSASNNGSSTKNNGAIAVGINNSSIILAVGTAIFGFVAGISIIL